MNYVMDSALEGQRIERKTNVQLTLEQLRWAGVRPGLRVLDVGCAAGTTTRLIADLLDSDGMAVGIDGSAQRIQEARAYPNQKISYRQGLAEQLPAEDGEFDLCWSRFLFEYLLNPAQAMAEMVRVVRPGGTVAVSDLDGNCLWHFPIEEWLESEVVQALCDLARVGFDPLVGRKLYGLAYAAGLTGLEVWIQPYHQIAGRISPQQEAHWRAKLSTIVEVLIGLGWQAARAKGLVEGFMEHLKEKGTFTYSTLITVKGQRP